MIDIVEYYTPDPDVGLFGGRWVPNGRGTLDWVQEREPLPAPEPTTKPRRPARIEDNCKKCGVVFMVSRYRLRYCSDECKEAGFREHHRIGSRASRERYRPFKPCAICGVGLPDNRLNRCRECDGERAA